MRGDEGGNKDDVMTPLYVGVRAKKAGANCLKT